jgi:hypothetical protein
MVDSLLQMSRQQLEGEPLGSLLLIVRAPADDDSGQFVDKLVSCILKETPLSNESQRWPMTSEFPTLSRNEPISTDADQVKLLSELSEAAHIIVPLIGSPSRKIYLVGRGPQCTIGLSDPSVSSEHSRLHLIGGGVRIEDAGSKNGTRLNDELLAEGQTPWLQPMDRISFGRVRAFTCDPRALRAVLRHDLSTLIS